MFVKKVISYRNSWGLVSDKYREELSEALESISDYISGSVEISKEFDGSPRSRDFWEKALYDRNWEIVGRTHYSSDGRRIHLGNVGPVKNGLSAQIPFGHVDYLSRWLFQQTALAVRHGFIKLPILFVPLREFGRESEDKWINRSSFEAYQSQLELLSPLSHQYPFLVVGYSDQSIFDELEVIEIEVDELAEDTNKVVDRCIEFPPEYHQAGLDILNYFGTYLREQYPEEEAKVRIEQEGLNVRLVIKTENGKTEVIEKALHEYELIITGEVPPEKFTQNDKLVLELRNELRIAKFRLESQQDLIGMQNSKIDKLLDIVGDGLSSKQPITIDFKPVVSNQNSITINQNISSAIGSVSELLSELPPASEAAMALGELEGSLEGLETNNNPEEIRRAPAMNKFKRIVDKLLESGNELNSGVEKIESGIEMAKDLAKKYNKVAEWCGLPVVPSGLLG
ncbi:hypothetical protein J3455_14665 [Pseudoalteromonas sp. NFXS39]|uniref:hypothetical protein n=1 Tax=Pseudoalteromonas TaxID=53246 RepID=UPI0030B5CC56